MDAPRVAEAVVFDLYGTLIGLDRDTRPYLRFARFVHPGDPRDLVRQSLLTTTRGIGDFAARLGVFPPSDITSLDADLQRDLKSARAFDDVHEALRRLRGFGMKLGLISNLATPYKEPFYRLGLADYFDTTLFSCDVGLRKPDPMVFIQMARDLGVNVASVVMVGDSRGSDYNGARAVGMEAVLLRRIGEARGERWIRNLSELPGQIQVWPGHTD